MSRSPRATLVLALICACAPRSPRQPAPTDAAVADASMAAATAGTTSAPPPNPGSILASACVKDSALAPLLPSNILFVIDRSGSMECNPPPTTTSVDCELSEMRVDTAKPSKWELASQALGFALPTLPESTKVGVSYFSNGDACGVSSMPSVPLAANTQEHRDTIFSSLIHIKPSGKTPLVGATILAYRYMHETALTGKITGNQYVILITDGQQSETCGDPQRCTGAEACTTLLAEEVLKAAGPGVNIRTFVIGVPGSEGAKVVLSQIAKNGGTALPNCSPLLGNCHFDMTLENGADLGPAMQRALQTIAGQTKTCDLNLPTWSSGDAELELLNVAFTPFEEKQRIVPQDTHAPCDGGANGWQFSPSNDQIRLCGDACDNVRDDRGGRVDVVLGCPTVMPD